AITNFLFGVGNPWPQFVHTYSSGMPQRETIKKLASPLEIFARFSPPASCTPSGTCTWNTPSDLCGFASTWPCDRPTGALLWPTVLWSPLQTLVTNWRSYAGTVEAYPVLPPGKCTNTPPAGTFCAAIMDVKALMIANYKRYLDL